MSSVNLFSNVPKFCNKPVATNEILSLPIFNAMVEGNPNTCSWAKCSDPNLGTTFRKNVVHTAIRCGGEPIDFNFMETMFPNQGFTTPSVIGSKRWFNHYQCDPNYNVYAKATVTGASPGAEVTFQLLESNHSSSGATSPLAEGFSLMDIENSVVYTITEIDSSNNYGHLITVVPNDGAVTAQIKANKPYLFLSARQVGGCNCAFDTNTMNTIGYTQQVRPIRIRRDWRICIDLLTGYEDKVQYTVIYDMNGNPVDAWDALEAQNARQGLRSTLNLLAFNGTPVTNAALINVSGSEPYGVDDNHTGFYGFIPTLKYGGGNRYGYPSHVGFDLESDGDAILLYQDSLKRTKKFLIMHGLKFMLDLINRTNLIVAQQTPFTDWEAYRRQAEYMGDADISTAIAKLGIKSYQYKGLDLDFKKMDSWSDYRFAGRDYLNGLAVWVPATGVKEGGREISPIEFNTYGGDNGWTGGYHESFVDFRTTAERCNDIGGTVAESMAMTVHCPGQFIITEPIKSF